jgi:hypothetical protein
MKTFTVLCATACAIIAQVTFIGLNGLTLLTIPLTLFLGIEAADRLRTRTAKNEQR